MPRDTYEPTSTTAAAPAGGKDQVLGRAMSQPPPPYLHCDAGGTLAEVVQGTENNDEECNRRLLLTLTVLANNEWARLVMLYNYYTRNPCYYFIIHFVTTGGISGKLL